MSLVGESSPVPSLTHRDPEGQDHSPGIDLTSACPISCPLIPPFKLQGKTSIFLTSHLLPAPAPGFEERLGLGVAWRRRWLCRLWEGLILPLPQLT